MLCKARDWEIDAPTPAENWSRKPTKSPPEAEAELNTDYTPWSEMTVLSPPLVRRSAAVGSLSDYGAMRRSLSTFVTPGTDAAVRFEAYFSANECRRPPVRPIRVRVRPTRALPSRS